MKKIMIDTWRLESEEELLSDFEAGPAVIRLAESEGKTDDLHWFFESAYVNYKAGTASLFFTSYKTPEYAGFALTVKATKRQDGTWTYSVTKKNRPNGVAEGARRPRPG